jgi:cell division protein ZapA
VSDLSVENKVVVRIFGEEYPITGSDDPAYISKVADFVDSRMQELARKSRTKARDKVAILTALSLASELLEQSDKYEQVSGESKSSMDGLLAQLDEALSGT